MKKIKGMIPPMVTPLLDNETLDLEGAKAVADRMLNAGVSGVFLLGTTGEAQSISLHLRYEFVEAMCKYIAGRVPVLVGVTETSMEESLKLAHHADKCGATAVVSAPPYYFPANQAELLDWYRTLADNSPLPVFLYNMPSKVKVNLDLDTVRELSLHPNIYGIKDSSGDRDYLRSLVLSFANSDFAVYVGPEHMTGEMVLLGADGGVSGGANLFPKLFVDNYLAAAAGNLSELAVYQHKIEYLAEKLYTIAPDSDASFLRSLKCALGLGGVCSDYVALPYTAFTGNQKDRVKAVLSELKSNNYA